MSAYYNENDPFAAQWLRELIDRDVIAPGDVDERSIEDVKPIDLRGYSQCHFFAGIGVWSYALRLARWPDDRAVWTGSCPCQPFSQAGKRKGVADERHLWPSWFHLIEQCNPDVIFGEQVASKDGLAWLDLVQADLEAEGYATAAVDLCAAGVGAPHIRQRAYWVAESRRQRFERERLHVQPREARFDLLEIRGSSETCELGDACCRRSGRNPRAVLSPEEEAERRMWCIADELEPTSSVSFWTDCDWIDCLDGKQRPVEPLSFPLVDGAPARVGRLRGYGNAIVAQAAQAFIEAYNELQA